MTHSHTYKADQEIGMATPSDTLCLCHPSVSLFHFPFLPPALARPYALPALVGMPRFEEKREGASRVTGLGDRWCPIVFGTHYQSSENPIPSTRLHPFFI